MEDLAQMMKVAGVDRTVLGSHFGCFRHPKPVVGRRMIKSKPKIISTNAAGLLGLAA